MIVKSVVVGMLHTNCYILGDEETGRCAVIDPGANEDKILSAVREQGLEVESIILTHGHFDHVMAASRVQNATGAKLFIHKFDLPLLEPSVVKHRGYIRGEYAMPRVDGYLNDGDTVKVGSLECRVYNTPGHTSGSCIILCGDIMFSGDTLFHESCGRWDLDSGDEGDMMRSLKKIAQIEGDYKVLPGHGGATTLAYERGHNRYMAAAMQE